MDEPDRLDAIRRRVAPILALPTVKRLQAGLDTFDGAGGGLLAGGLAFTALFALVPAVLLVLGVAGLVLSDDERRAAAIDELATYVPPLRDLFAASLADMARSAVSTSIFGLAALVWGASRFMVALDDAFSRIFHEDERRGFVGRTARGIASVGVLLATVVVVLGLSAVASFLADSLRAEVTGTAATWQVVSTVVGAAVASVAVAVLYRAVPTRRLAWRTIAPPAIVVGTASALLTQLFAYVAPRLIGAAEVLGGIAAVFATLAWLQLMFQALLLGAAWASTEVRPPEPG